MPRPRMGTVGQGGSPEDWFKSLPPVTRTLLVSILGATLLSYFGIVNPYSLGLFWPRVWGKFEIWRLYTNVVFMGLPSMAYLMRVIIFFEYSKRYETDPFNTGGGGGSADYTWMLLFGATVMTALSVLFFPMPFLGTALMYMIMYVWSRKSPDVMASFWFITVQAVYIPWVMVGFQLLTGNSIFDPLFGIAVGHLYYFLVDVLPDMHGWDLLHTPKFLVDFIGYGQPDSGVYMQAPGARGPPGARPQPFPMPGRGRDWGQGNTLGTG